MTRITTKIAKNGAANVYINGKRTSREAAVKFAEENKLPTYTATCYAYSERNYCISEDFATALSAYKWLMSQARKSRNVADGSWEINRWDIIISESGCFSSYRTMIYEYNDRGKEINADDEPEFATFIYAKLGEVDAAIEDYAVTVDAQDAAVEGEIEQATATSENESEDDFKLYPIDVAIYHGGDILTDGELEDYAAQFRDAITANGNFGTVEIGESYLSVYGNTGGDNKTIWKLIGDLCWRGDCCLEGYGSKETDYELREMPGEEIDAMLARMGIDNAPPAFVIPEFDAAVKKVFGDDAPAVLTPCGQVTLEIADEPDTPDAEIDARIDGYLNTAYNLEGMAEELEIICDDFDDDARDEKDRHVASRISFYREHVKRGIEGLREMIDWYIQRADFAESNAK